jgi:hypothetical protein
MHAVIFQVDFVPGRESQQEAELEFLASMMQGTPGFVRGTWLDDGTRGLSCLVFRTEEAARAVAASAVLPPEASAKLRSVDVYRVARSVDSEVTTSQVIS